MKVGAGVLGWWVGVIFTTCSRVTFPIRPQLSCASFPPCCRLEVIICVKNGVFAAALAALIFDKSILLRALDPFPALTKTQVKVVIL